MRTEPGRATLIGGIKTTSSESEAADTRRKNRIVVIALLCGLIAPFLYIAFLAEHLPDWLDAVIVGGIFWICFVEIIPANIVGIFRRPKERESRSRQRAGSDRRSYDSAPPRISRSSKGLTPRSLARVSAPVLAGRS